MKLLSTLYNKIKSIRDMILHYACIFVERVIKH